ncbi:MAG: hypothetical protein IPM79_04290 [Polyangiaceae bacterium]|nr:hypothetical protein [Polyangiaceae bacterium]
MSLDPVPLPLRRGGGAEDERTREQGLHGGPGLGRVATEQAVEIGEPGPGLLLQPASFEIEDLGSRLQSGDAGLDRAELLLSVGDHADDRLRLRRRGEQGLAEPVQLGTKLGSTLLELGTSVSSFVARAFKRARSS